MLTMPCHDWELRFRQSDIQAMADISSLLRQSGSCTTKINKLTQCSWVTRTALKMLPDRRDKSGVPPSQFAIAKIIFSRRLRTRLLKNRKGPVDIGWNEGFWRKRCF